MTAMAFVLHPSNNPKYLVGTQMFGGTLGIVLAHPNLLLQAFRWQMEEDKKGNNLMLHLSISKPASLPKGKDTVKRV